jgi:hypothetical protein
VNFKLPEGWKQQREKGFLHSSISKEGLKTVITISKASGKLLDNVNRWNRQLGNSSQITEQYLAQISQKQNVNGRFGILILLTKQEGKQAIANDVANSIENPHGHQGNPHAGTPTIDDPMGIRIAFTDIKGLTWYIKMMGSANTLIREKNNFETFVKSFNFDQEKPTWTLPSTWTEEAGTGMIVASFNVAGAKITLIPIPTGGGDLTSNVNRWRTQLALPAISTEEINKQLQFIEASNLKYTYLFITASTSPANAPSTSEDHPTVDGRVTQTGISFSLPEGWAVIAPSGMRKVNLTSGAISITGIVLGEEAKGVKKNVDRWCEQVGIPAPNEDELKKINTSIDFAGGKADYSTIIGAEQSILTVIYEQGNSVWFFKAMGPTAEIKQQKNNFEAFAKGLKFEGVR